MIQIFFTLDQAQGKLVQSILLAEGIEVYSPNFNTVAIGYGNPVGGIELMVKESEQKRAVQMLRERGLLET